MKHFLCLTLDTDPDGLNARTPNRQSLEWEGLERVQRLPEELEAFPALRQVPVTWFVRADGQLESILGSAAYLLERFKSFWAKVEKAGHEVAWHPHLYRQARPEDAAVIITDPLEAQDELERLWNHLKLVFHPTAFRHGEGWHSQETYAVVEQMGFRCDSTAIPGRRGGDGHPMNWEGAPNQPYFPSSDNLCTPGPARPMLELPMNTWILPAPHDTVPRIRYMNPAVHPQLFAKALRNWENALNSLSSDLCIWVMIFHPDEVLVSRGADALYSRSIRELCVNLVAIAESLRRVGHDFEWATVSDAADRWRTHRLRLTS
ncbi:MAG TPA: hypothetical protein VE377_25375 [Candidatus Dormibacteraeota bacterium]|nr:hypothetical protein [Candidatus Dormibacteraeota bacterium]